VRLLFVGGDFSRKGGHHLLQAFSPSLRERCELHIVTWEPIEAAPGVHVYHNIAPHSEVLRHHYMTADLFVLPTLADCYSCVSIEAMACGLPVISCPVGGIPEIVLHEQTGLLVPPGDIRALGAAIDALARDPAKRQAMGMRGRVVVGQRFSAVDNARRVLDMMTTLAKTKGLYG
jgi:glycosyltransferase involved in cell wall biosynthesis